MERLLKWIDDVEDLLAMAQLQARPVIVALLLLAAITVTIAVLVLFGPPQQLGAP